LARRRPAARIEGHPVRTQKEPSMLIVGIAIIATSVIGGVLLVGATVSMVRGGYDSPK